MSLKIMKIEYFTKWEKDSNLIITRLTGFVTELDVKEWEIGLKQVFRDLPKGTKFKMFVNFHGLSPSTVTAHKSYRDVIPLLLSQYGWRIGYLDLFEEANDLTISKTNESECYATVHCHQDGYKIQEYERRFGKENEHFYEDPIFSEAWIRSYEYPTLVSS
ncbi:hypothetical protein [Leptospira levettii]|uniref:hypothetical protein n=1 Tax=Leptospira levettii TaxID=2023178 RepID=UPI001FEF486D|nr:hypothetical protein [Leptospira levettii]